MRLKAFLSGVLLGMAIWGAAFVAFAAVIRRGVWRLDEDVLIDAKSLWWTHDEQRARDIAVLTGIEQDAQLAEYRGPRQ